MNGFDQGIQVGQIFEVFDIVEVKDHGAISSFEQSPKTKMRFGLIDFGKVVGSVFPTDGGVIVGSVLCQQAAGQACEHQAA